MSSGMDIINEQWSTILNTVREEHNLTDISFKTWLKPLSVYAVNDADRIVTILVPSEQMAVEYIEKKYMFPLRVAIAEITGTEYDIEFLLPSQLQMRQFEQPARTSAHTRDNSAAEQANLSSRYTFDTFVVGSNNKLAHAAALAVAESPGQIYNPLFVYGGAGLGKTHLMHSIGNFILDTNPDAKVLYVTSEQFTNELINAIRNNNNNASAASSFREKYRRVDVLLIDDIQFIIGKESTQEEFFHTFNDLRDNKKQIILSSDKPPRELKTLEERLRSRFEWGIIVDISSPDYETRVAILRKKAETDGYDVDDKVIQYIANNVQSNIRELEGALNKLIALSKLENREINVELAEEALKDIISPEAQMEVSIPLIVSTVAEHFHIQVDDIIGSKRSRDIALPRQICMYLCRELTTDPLTAIGSYLGGRDHSTILHGIDKIEKELPKSRDLKNDIDVLRKKINID